VQKVLNSKAITELVWALRDMPARNSADNLASQIDANFDASPKRFSMDWRVHE